MFSNKYCIKLCTFYSYVFIIPNNPLSKMYFTTINSKSSSLPVSYFTVSQLHSPPYESDCSWRVVCPCNGWSTWKRDMTQPPEMFELATSNAPTHLEWAYHLELAQGTYLQKEKRAINKVIWSNETFMFVWTKLLCFIHLKCSDIFCMFTFCLGTGFWNIFLSPLFIQAFIRFSPLLQLVCLH